MARIHARVEPISGPTTRGTGIWCCDLGCLVFDGFFFGLNGTPKGQARFSHTHSVPGSAELLPSSKEGFSLRHARIRCHMASGMSSVYLCQTYGRCFNIWKSTILGSRGFCHRRISASWTGSDKRCPGGWLFCLDAFDGVHLGCYLAVFWMQSVETAGKPV